MKKRAFTLTELLVVVVIIGVLSAVVLPKFTKVLQTRKTTEAENVMAAVRNEQEARCMVGRHYVGQNEIGKLASLPKATSKNYTYTLDAQGITATAKDGDYTLQIPSYADGRICCSGEGCEKLNKDYPACNDTFLAAIDQSPCEAPEVPENQNSEPEPEPDPTPQGCGEKPAQLADEPCGCNNTGHKSYTWNEAECKWEIGATCEGENTAPCEIPACVKPVKPADEPCGCNNTGHKSYTWNEAECKWEIGTTCEGEDKAACEEKKCEEEIQITCDDEQSEEDMGKADEECPTCGHVLVTHRYYCTIDHAMDFNIPIYTKDGNGFWRQEMDVGNGTFTSRAADCAYDAYFHSASEIRACQQKFYLEYNTNIKEKTIEKDNCTYHIRIN